ncbi:hypothetical protein ACFQ21_03430 [Ohtaekwangia kribbensis]|uniref:Uncharacterized protein n=1 Tax=Ohtaekwangia kribbensis TaxID=688913 RepID=A0ABW3JZ82_9BACT
MKSIIQVWMSSVLVLVIGAHVATAQKIDDERMRRDISVAENVLGTLIKQQFSNQRTFFQLEIKGNYQQGYGVTFSLPADYTTPIAFTLGSGNGVVVYSDEFEEPATIDIRGSEDGSDDRAVVNGRNTYKLKEKTKGRTRGVDMDSIRDAYNLKVIEAAKEFILDYSDMISQLGPQERIVVTNQGNQPRAWVGQYFNAPNRTHLSIEALKSDIAQYKAGKLTRVQADAKIKVVNTESTNAVEPDLELLSSIFSRLYRVDLSKTYFTEENIYYERLKDYGVIYYMQVYSSSERDYKRFDMPTLNLQDVDQATRNKKVGELYPAFERELKENVLEYGKTVKSLKDDEVLIFQVRLTRCASCGIPSSLEISVKGSVLKDVNAGKLDKNAALAKLIVKKGENQ